MTLISWDDNNRLGLVLCMSFILVIVLMWYIRNQNYKTACDRKLNNMKVLLLTQAIECSSRVPEGYNHKAVTDGDKKKSKLNPEKCIMDQFTMGDTLNITNSGIIDPLTMDAFIDLKSEESMDQQLHRSLTDADYDGPQIEGMAAPIDEFERHAMVRQLEKRQEVYGDQSHEFSDADMIAELNI
jgi:hypothetical protein